jgi:hypothetical protein
MTQVDFVVYIPLLFWFVILFIVFYALMYIYIIPLLFSTLKVKQLFFSFLMTNLSISNLFLEVNYFLNDKNLKNNFYHSFKFTYLIKYFYNLNSILKLIK